MMRVPRYLPDVPAKQGRTAVYRFYDRRGRLLYVGITNSLRHRFAQHAAEKPWWKEVHRTTVRWYSTRRAALEAEWLAIKTEHPVHNVQHNGGRRTRRQARRRSASSLVITMLVATGLLAGAWSGAWALTAIMQIACIAAVLIGAWIAWGRVLQ